ncbi:MAG: bifunctional hydroxymethylpyrimidine kinase/phosphomethylpyrimidine kinase [Selenomonas noxia]
MMKMHTALTIAGSDSSGGAGIQADLKTMTAHGVYGMSAVTALTAQNTMGVTDILAVPPAFLAAQLDAVFADIPPDAVKIGMVADAALIHVIAEKLDEYDAKNVVVDPVMVATSGARLISEDAVEALVSELLPRAALITPNIPEAEVLADMAITDRTAMTAAAACIHERTHAAVLMKGGHSIDDANDLLVDDTGARWFEGRRIATSNTHGTGCTLSSAIASNLARGIDTDTAVAQAKAYLSGALAAGLDLGHGSGPLAHTFDLKSRFIV